MEESAVLHWSWRPTKRRLFPGCLLFEDGDIYCNLLLKQLPLENTEKLVSRFPEFVCCIAGCEKSFDTLLSYESHYNGMHRNVCSICKKVLPTNHLLDIHVLEWHDTMFELMAASKPMYKCLLEICPEKFCSTQERKNHLIEVHRYPANFRFDRRKKQQKLRSTVTMETDAMDSYKKCATTPRRFVYKVPKIICFGQNAVRGFQSYNKRTNKGQKKKHWHQVSKQDDSCTTCDIEKMQMDDLAAALDNT